MKNALYLSAILFLSFAQPAFAFDDKAFCAEQQEGAKMLNEAAAATQEGVMKQNGMNVDCGAKIIEISQTINALKKNLGGEWESTMQKAWNDSFCGPGVPFRDAIMNGWNVTNVFTFVNGD